MSTLIVETEEAHLPGVYEVIGSVALEGKYLAFTKVPPWASSLEFYRGLLKSGSPYFVAVAGEEVVGWCDVSLLFGESRAHIGVLGLGLLPEFRRQGLGRKLMEAAIAKSWSIGLRRLELSVREDNHNAIALYKNLGFEAEGLRRNASIVGTEVHNVWAMALLK